MDMAHMRKNVSETALVAALLLITIILIVYRASHIDGLLIYRHSYGESQYATWAKAYLKEGFFWGIKEVDRFQPITDYFPLSSLVAAWVYGLIGGNLVAIGRTLSFLFSVVAALYYYRYALLLFKSRLVAAASLLIFTSLPINMYYSKTFYNDPIHFCCVVIFFYYLHRSFTDTRSRSDQILMTAAFALILLTKASTVLMCLPVIGYFTVMELKKKGRVPYARLLPLILPLLLSAVILITPRLLHSDAYFVESNKMFNNEVMGKLPVYLAMTARLYLDEFGYFCILFIIGAVVALVRRERLEYFVFMAAGFLVFYLLMLRGAIVHQYYSLPFALPFSVLATYGLFCVTGLARSERVQHLLVACFMASLLFSGTNIKREFRPIYSRGLVEASDFMNARADRSSTLVLGKTCRIMQYYLDLPTSNIKCDRDDFVKSANIAEYSTKHLINFIVTEDDNPSIDGAIERSGFGPIFKSSDVVSSKRYVIYGRI
jgi:4-amino-4-deoxy-L-arabinose transferase-like glycosyltransferase